MQYFVQTCDYTNIVIVPKLSFIQEGTPFQMMCSVFSETFITFECPKFALCNIHECIQGKRKNFLNVL